MNVNNGRILDRDRTLIGALASHDNIGKNESLAKILDQAVKDNSQDLKGFAFVFTGGTFDRLFLGSLCQGQQPGKSGHQLEERTRRFLLEECGVIRLPDTTEGGVIVLSHLVTQGLVSLLWTFLTPLTAHFINPENLALLRLADHRRAKKLINSKSVQEWIDHEVGRDKDLNTLPSSTTIPLGEKNLCLFTTKQSLQDKSSGGSLGDYIEVQCRPFRQKQADDSIRMTRPGSNGMVVALISHDEMKSRMQDFVADHERKLNRFDRILATGTTGRLVEDAAPLLKKNRLVHRYHSGPKGGDIEIATEILAGTCGVVIFFVDPLSAHPHTDDIRVIFGACMICDNVIVLTNDVQARNWMSRSNP